MYVLASLLGMIFHTLLFQRSGGDSCCIALPGFFKGRIFLKGKILSQQVKFIYIKN